MNSRNSLPAGTAASSGARSASRPLAVLHRFAAPWFAWWLALVALVAAPAARAGFSVSGGVLFDNNGNPFVMRGINHPHVWYTSQTAAALTNIAATGANCVRIVLANGVRWTATSQADVASLIAQCKAAKLIAILEVHDTTGWGEQAGAATLASAVDYWISIQGALTGQENYVILNIGNEPYGNNVPASTWTNEHVTAISRLRTAGFTHTIMVDAANWGQDWQNIARDNAATVFNADPRRNTIFSVHMYEVYQQASVIDAYLAAFVNADLPICVGEFAATHGSNDVNEAAVMERCQFYGLGYIGWSWSGNGAGLEALDVVQNFNPATRTTWGNTLIAGATGIAATSQVCSVFNTTTPSLALSASTLALGAAAGSGTVGVTSNTSWTVTDDQSWLSVSPTGGSNNANLTISASANTAATARTGTVTVTGGGLTRTVSVTQAGATATTLTVSPTALSVGAAAGSGTFAITSNTSWSVADDQSWLSVAPASGSNNATVTVTATANTAATARTGTVTVSGGGLTRTVAITQAAPANGTTTTIQAEAGTYGGGVTIDSNNAGYTGTGFANFPANGGWLQFAGVSGGSGGTASLAIRYALGGSPARTGQLLVNGTAQNVTFATTGAWTTWSTLTLNVTLAAGTANTLRFQSTGADLGNVDQITVTTSGGTTNTLAVTPTSVALAAAAGGTNVAVTSNVSWTATDDQSWLTVSPASGANDATVTLTATANTATAARSGTVTIAGGGITRTVAVTQAGAGGGTTPCTNPVTVTLPFQQNGVGEFCFFTTGTISNVNSWNTQLVEINGVAVTNAWTGTMPARINGGYYVRYVATVAWAHLEINGSN